MNKALNEDAGGVNLVGIEFTRFDEVFHLGNRDLSTRGSVGIEVACGPTINEVALGIRFPGFYQCQIRMNAALENTGLPIEVLMLFAFSNDGADAGARIETGNARASGAKSLGECSLRAKLNFNFVGQELPFKLRILADVAGDHLLDLVCREEETEGCPVYAGVVAGDGEITNA